MTDIHNSGKCSIDTQVLNENAVAINAGTYNNIIFEDPFRYYSEIELKKNPESANKITLIELLIQKENLKKRFLGIHSKYEELMKSAAADTIEADKSSLDDGYKSIISCIINIINCFEYKANEDGYLLVNENDNLLAKITTNGLEIFYSNKVKTYDEYIKAAIDAEELKENITPYIRCATTYGNFLQFGNIFINKIDQVPFIPEKIKFRVSNEIIPNLIKPLYGDAPECGLREIIQNACDATKELEKEYSTDEHIELNIQKNEDKTILTVRDYGIGMTKEILLNKYFVIGESSKKGNNKNLVGQFGIGALAAFLLGDKISVKTKHFESKLIYSFEYELTSNENNPIAVSITQDESFECGTEVSIALNKNLSELSQNDLEIKLNINNWYVLPDVTINYTYNSEIQEIQSFTGELYKWEQISSNNENEYVIKYLNEKVIKEDETSNHRAFIEKPQIIYNGLMVPTSYELNKLKSKYLKRTPYISISSSSDLIALNLERSKIEKGLDLITEPIETELINKGLSILKEEKNNIVSEDGTILMLTYNNDYLKDIPLFFTKEGFGVLTTNSNYSDFIEVYGYYGLDKVKLDDLISGKKYIFKSFIPNKSDLATLIEDTKAAVVSNVEIKKYFFDAPNYNYGFKTDTMKYLYKNAFEVNYDNPSSAQEFWRKHNEIKKKVFEPFFDEPKNIYIPKNVKSPELLQSIKSKTKSCIVAYSNYLRDESCDKCFDIGIVK